MKTEIRLFDCDVGMLNKVRKFEMRFISLHLSLVMCHSVFVFTMTVRMAKVMCCYYKIKHLHLRCGLLAPCC